MRDTTVELHTFRRQTNGHLLICLPLTNQSDGGIKQLVVIVFVEGT